MKNVRQSGRQPKCSSWSVFIPPCELRNLVAERCQMTNLRCRSILPAQTLVSQQVPCLGWQNMKKRDNKFFMQSPGHCCRYLAMMGYQQHRNMGYTNIIWDIPVLMTYPNISWDIPKLNKTDGISRNNSTCDLSRDIPKQVSLFQLIPAVCFSPLEKWTAGISWV